MYKIQSKSPPTHVRVEKTCVSPHIYLRARQRMCPLNARLSAYALMI